jgi:DNA-binding protein HU-beta
MKKSELIDAVAAKVGSKKVATDAVDALLETITATVAKGEKVTIPGFGTFERAERPPRKGRRPDGTPWTVPATRVPKFTVGATFKDAVKGGAR